MDIKLDDVLIDVKIGEYTFKVDINSFEAIECMTRFKEKYVFIPKADLEMLSDCKVVIDTILGEGTHDKLFGSQKTMKTYLLVNELANIYLDNFMKEERERQEFETEEEMRKVNSMLDKFNNFTKTMQYAGNKYGMKNHVSRNTSNKHKNRRN